MAEQQDWTTIAQDLCSVSDIMHRALAETPDRRQCESCARIVRALEAAYERGRKENTDGR